MVGREETEVDLETDTSHNNRPKAGFEAGTRIFSPLVENNATLVRRNLDSLREENILNVRAVTSDSSAQLDKTLGDYSATTGTTITQYTCFIHKLRSGA